MRRQVVTQSDFSFGELSDDHVAAVGDAVKASLKKGRNCRILNSYGFSQRFGSRFLNELSLGVEATVITSDGQTFIAHIRDGGIDFCDADGNVVSSVEGAPWSASQATEVVWHTREDELYIAHNEFWPQLATYDSGTWTIGNFRFGAGPGSSKLQLYYRFGDRSVTMTPSALTGNIMVNFSAAVLHTGHVNTRFRYLGREVLITAFVSATRASATVIDELPPTQKVHVKDATGFRTGDVVEGSTSGTVGFISQIDLAGSWVYVGITSGFAGFIDTEKMVGPDHVSDIYNDGLSVKVDPAASVEWDEQVFSDLRGYPGSVFEQVNRLGFANFPQIPDAVALSAPGDVTNFSIGTGEAQDAIFERVGESLGQTVLYCVGAANLIVLTDKRIYYVPQSADTPLSGATIEFVEVGPAGSSNAFPAVDEEGVIYVEAGRNRVMGLLATGNITAPWKLTDLSRHSSQVINAPVSLALTNGNSVYPERYIFVLNGDGTVATLFFDAEQSRLGWTPWDTAGSWLSMTVMNGDVYTLCSRDLNGTDHYFLEKFDSTAQLDASKTFDTADVGELLDMAGDPLLDDAGDTQLAESVIMAHLAGETVAVVGGTNYLGTFDVQINGSLALPTGASGTFEAGYHFTMDAVLWTPQPQFDQRAQFNTKRISRAAVRVKDSGVYGVGIEGASEVYIRPAYDQGDNFDSEPPLRSEVWRKTLPGWKEEPCVEITRPIPHPLTVLSVAMEVAF